jgi:ferric-dicitrate binding protein FerR (iron transport regulator)
MKKLISYLFWCTLTLPTFANTLHFIRGEVTVNNTKAQPGSVVKAGDHLITGPQSLAIVRLDGGVTLRIEPSSEIRLQLVNDKTQGNRIGVLRGSLISRLQRSAEETQQPLTIQTRQAAMGVRGTLFFVGIEEQKDEVWMCVQEGSVEVRGREDSSRYMVKAGEGVVIRGDGKSSSPTFFPWTTKLNWELEEHESIVTNENILQEAYVNPIRRQYD